LPVGTTIKLALVSEVKELDKTNLARVATALQKQITRDFKPFWNVDATIELFESLDSVPNAHWPIIVKTEIGVPGAAGIHEEKNGQAFALITYSSDFDTWTLTASHVLLEMLADPWGNRLTPGPSPNRLDKGKIVHFLVEICNPVENAEYAYKIDDVMVSDFTTPAFYRLPQTEESRFSFNGAVKEPLKILRGGYISWKVPETKEWHQQTWFEGDRPRFVSLGKLN
jgi:hypothetical protein